MTYDAREISVRNGAPVEMYRFVRGGTTYRYTSADQNVSTNTETFTPALISRGALSRGQDRRTPLEITVPRDNAVAELLDASGVPLDPIAVTVLRNHVGETSSAYITIFVGQVMSAKWEGSQVTLSCETAEALLERQGLRIPVQRTCPWMLYDGHCQADAASFLFASTVSAVSGAVVTVTGLSTEAGSDKTRFLGGYLKYAHPSASYNFGGSIIAQSGSDTITLSFPNADIAIGDSVQVYPGCDRSLAVCHSRFTNETHFGGFPALPVRNPFTGAGLDGNLG